MFLTAVRLGSFSNKHYMSPKQQEKWEKTLRGRYTKGLRKHHFLLFGVPFMAALYFGSVYLAEFTAIKFKMHDDRVQMMTEEEALSVGQNKRKVDMRDEYYVCCFGGVRGDVVPGLRWSANIFFFSLETATAG